MRHEQTVGLIGAKKTGGDAMTGDIGAFFDCHVAPQPGWWKDFLTLIGQNWRRMVVPQITALDIDTWKQQVQGSSKGGGSSRGAGVAKYEERRAFSVLRRTRTPFAGGPTAPSRAAVFAGLGGTLTLPLEQGAGGGMAKCYLTWDADFKWFDSEDLGAG